MLATIREFKNLIQTCGLSISTLLIPIFNPVLTVNHLTFKPRGEHR